MPKKEKADCRQCDNLKDYEDDGYHCIKGMNSTNCEPAAKDKGMNDYIYCSDCNCYVSFFKYGHSIEDSGHDGHQWRYVDPNELMDCIVSDLETYPRCAHCGSLNVEAELAADRHYCPDCRAYFSYNTLNWVNHFTDN